MDFAKPASVGGSARVSEAVARVLRARTGGQSSAPARPRDPAPSRTAYKMSRLWLTPSFRFAMRRLAPIGAVLAVIAIWAGNEENRQFVADHYMTMKSELQNRPEFMVKLMAIDGASEDLATDIREVAPIDFPLSSFDLDLKGMLQQIESLDAVAQAGVRVRAGGILQIDITERVPAVVWRGPQGLELLDHEGHRVEALEARQNRTDLPLIAGEGADREVGEALALLKAAQPLMARLRGIVRIGERRWDLVLDNDQTIQLPETNPFGALAQVITLHQAKDLLVRDVRIVDMRNPNRPTLRVSEAARDEFRRLKGL
jgi:cell division protein FtsQ